MLELLLFIALSIGVARAIRVPRRGSIILGGIAIVLTLADWIAVYGSSFEELHPLHLFIFAILGPSMWHLRAAGALPAVVVRVLRLCLVAGAAIKLWREATVVNPLLPRSEELQRVATPLVAAFVLDSVECVLVIAARYLAMA